MSHFVARRHPTPAKQQQLSQRPDRFSCAQRPKGPLIRSVPIKLKARCVSRAYELPLLTKPLAVQVWLAGHCCLQEGLVYPSAAMAPKCKSSLIVRKSSRHPLGSRARAAGYTGKSGWATHSDKEALERRKAEDPLYDGRGVRLSWVFEPAINRLFGAMCFCSTSTCIDRARFIVVPYSSWCRIDRMG